MLQRANGTSGPYDITNQQRHILGKFTWDGNAHWAILEHLRR
jgi:hypothetical protein